MGAGSEMPPSSHLPHGSVHRGLRSPVHPAPCGAGLAGARRGRAVVDDRRRGDTMAASAVVRSPAMIPLLLHAVPVVLATVSCGDLQEAPAPVVRMRAEAHELLGEVSTPVARAFLQASETLPPAESRTVYRTEEGLWLSPAAASALPAEEREDLEPAVLPASRYYDTKYGSPLAYVLAMEVAGRAGLDDVEGRRLLDFGYGTVGHLRLLAASGADAVGVDVDPFLPALYGEAEDQGAVPREGAEDGRVTMIDGRWPATEEARAAIGAGYDLFLSKNNAQTRLHPSGAGGGSGAPDRSGRGRRDLPGGPRPHRRAPEVWS